MCVCEGEGGVPREKERELKREEKERMKGVVGKKSHSGVKCSVVCFLLFTVLIYPLPLHSLSALPRVLWLPLVLLMLPQPQEGTTNGMRRGEGVDILPDPLPDPLVDLLTEP